MRQVVKVTVARSDVGETLRAVHGDVVEDRLGVPLISIVRRSNGTL